MAVSPRDGEHIRHDQARKRARDRLKPRPPGQSRPNRWSRLQPDGRAEGARGMLLSRDVSGNQQNPAPTTDPKVREQATCRPLSP